MKAQRSAATPGETKRGEPELNAAAGTITTVLTHAQVISGQLPMATGTHLRTRFLRAQLRGAVHELADVRPGCGEWPPEVLLRLVKLAVACTNSDDVEERPAMRAVAEELSELNRCV